MNQLIERYIHDVTRRLPEKERDEVRRELEANIADMLPDNPSEKDIIDVLNGLGAPAGMAGQYRQKPRYLISPVQYDLYITVLTTVVPIVAAVLACIGLLFRLPHVVNDGWSIGHLLGDVFGMALSAVLQAVFWITAGFVVADRTGIYKEKDWTIEDLPSLSDQRGGAIPRSESIISIAMTVFFTGLFALMLTRNEWILIFVRGTEIIYPFSQEIALRLVPYVIILGCLAVVISGLKLFWGRWNIPLCASNVIYNIVWVSIALYIINWPDLLDVKFVDFIERTFDGNISFILGSGTVTFFSALLIIIAVADIGAAAWKTWKAGGFRSDVI